MARRACSIYADSGPLILLMLAAAREHKVQAFEKPSGGLIEPFIRHRTRRRPFQFHLTAYFLTRSKPHAMAARKSMHAFVIRLGHDANAADAAVARHGHHTAEQLAADAAALKIVLNTECEFGFRRVARAHQAALRRAAERAVDQST